MQRAAAVAQARRYRELKNDEQKLDAAQEAYDQGDVDRAMVLLTRVATSRTSREHAETARSRVAEIQADGRRKLAEIDARLAGTDTPGEGDSAQRDQDYGEQVRRAFRDYETLERQFRRVPVVNREIANRLARQKLRDDYAAALREPEAAELWKYGQQLEADDQACCAYHVYREAVKHLPAPSATFARERLAVLERDEQFLREARVCGELQWCHRTFDQASRLVKVRPERARMLFTQIVMRSPADTEIHRAAERQLDELGRRG